MVNPVGNAKTPIELNIGSDINAELKPQQKGGMASLEEDGGESSLDWSIVVKPISADERPKGSAGETERDTTFPEDFVEGSIESKMSSFEIIDNQNFKAINEPEVKVRREEEEKRMKSSIPGRAWDLVKAILVLSSQIEDFEAIAEDDMIYLAERLLRAQKCSKELNLPWTVDIAYHHTQSINLKTIKTDGLLSLQEREERNIRSPYNGSVHGDGIYCSKDPILFGTGRRYGDTVIMLARMKGLVSFNESNYFCDTLLRSGFCVLKRCNQCIPLFQFKSELLGSIYPAQNSSEQDRFERFREKLAVFQKMVQGQLDQIVNDNITTQVDIAWVTRYNNVPEGVNRRNARRWPMARQFSLASMGPGLVQKRLPLLTSKPSPKNSLRPLIHPFASSKMVKMKGRGWSSAPGQYGKIVARLSYDAPDNLATTDSKDFCKPYLTCKQLCSNCPICGDLLRTRGKVVQTSNCGHIFHNDCLQTSMESQPCCTVCSLPISQSHWRGKMPSGTMTISEIQSHCHGFEGCPTYIIAFVFPAGLQKKYHPNPSMAFSSHGKYTRYLPASSGGTQLLERLKFAFLRGLLFSVGRGGSVVPEISLKASQEPPCFPDPLHIVKCNTELDRLHVPSAFKLSLSRAIASSNNTPVSPSQSNNPASSLGLVQTSEQTPSSSTDTNISTPVKKYANFLNDNLNFPVTWQSNDDLPDRRKVTVQIFVLLKTMIPEGSDFHQR